MLYSVWVLLLVAISVSTIQKPRRTRIILWLATTVNEGCAS